MKELTSLVKFMAKPWVLLVYCAIVVLSYFYIDTLVAVWLHNLHVRTEWPFLYHITNMAKGEFYVGGLFIFAVFFHYIWQNKRLEGYCWLFWICVTVPFILCVIIKITLGRARPDLFFDQHLFGFYGLHLHFERLYESFPSGHTTTVISLLTCALVIWPKCRYVFALMAAIVMITRILLTDHYVSDVLATALLTFFEVYVVLWLISKRDWSIKRLINA